MSNARYGQVARFDVAGQSLDKLTLSVASTACRAAPVASGTATSTLASFTCVIGSVGSSSVTASNGTTTLQTQAFTVAQPQVTLTLGGGVTGDIVIALEPAKTPVTVDNFLAYVNSGFYVGTLMHRAAPGFVIEGGGYTATRPTVTLKTANAPIALEVGKGLSNLPWTVAMVHGAGADTATSQFFVNLADNSAVNDPSVANAGFAVFGTVVGGTAVVTAVANAPCSAVATLSNCVPDTDIRITAATQTQ